MAPMTITDYLINAVFVLIVFRQARERELDRRSAIIPLAIVAYVAHLYVHSIPTAGNDLVLIAALGAVGLTLGVASGFATHVRAGENGLAVARVGWIAGALLIAGIGSRMVFAFALSHGAHHAVASFSIAHQIGAAAWPVALVMMALLEVSTRIAIVQLRGRQAMQSSVAIPAACMTSDLPTSHSPARPWRAGSRSIVRTAVTESELGSGSDSERVAEARARAQERLHRQRRSLRPLGWAVILVVVLGSANSHPVPGLHGKGLAVTLALCVFAVALLIAIRDSFPERSLELQAAVIAIMGAAGVAIGGLQLKGATGVAAGVAVFLAITRLPFKTGVALAGAVTVALAVVTAIAGSSSSAVAAEVLVTVLLGVVAQFLKRSRESQDQTELLLAELEDARDEQARAAAIAERGRIAGELHDVLAHSLSGAAIQLQGARKLADREHATPRLSEAIDRASELVKAGLANARQAVGTLRGDPLPTLA